MTNRFEYQEPLTPGGKRGVRIERTAAQRQALALLKRGGFLTVSAPPRSGVTTFLLGLKNLLPHAAYVDLANLSFMDDPPKEAARVLAREIAAAVPGIATPAHPANVTDVLNAITKPSKKEKQPAPEMVTVIIDGFDAWSDEPARKLVLALRAAYTELRTLPPGARQFSIITGSSMDLRDLTASGRTSPLNIAQQIFLQDFTREEVNELIREGLTEVAGAPEIADWSQHAWELASGHPAITQMIGQSAYDLRAAGRNPADAWKEIYPSVIESVTDLLGSTLGLLAGRDDLLHTAERIYAPDADVPFDRIHRPIRELLHLGLIRSDDRGIGRPRNQVYAQVLAAALDIAGAPHPSVALWRESAPALGQLRPGMKSGARHKGAGTAAKDSTAAAPSRSRPPSPLEGEGSGVRGERGEKGAHKSARKSGSGMVQVQHDSTVDVPRSRLAERDFPATARPTRRSPPLLSRGTILGGCGILQRIGRGGMGEVYLARHLALDMEVAIKVLHQFGGRDKRVEQRFLREARTAAQLNHENIVQIRNVGREGEYQFIEMEYLSGGSLADVLKHGPYMDIPRAIEYLRGAARGLQAAHERGIIHRDLKPDNLMLTREGKIKVVDFGLAVPGTLKGPRLTTEGTIIGTPHYMAPEQWESRDVDERSDIYSLGATFYHLFSGRTPYDGKTALELIANFSNSQKLEPPEKFNRALLPGISAMILKMIQKRPEDRLQGMTELLEGLNAFG